LAHVKAAIAPTTALGKITGGLAGGTNISKEANAAISDALDNGQIPQLVEKFNNTGQEAAARYAQALDDVRHASTNRYVSSDLQMLLSYMIRIRTQPAFQRRRAAMASRPCHGCSETICV